jgi:adenosylmethionine-8-amino-7-oxononanoate aminotransferase
MAQPKLEKWDKEFLWHPFTQHAVWSKDPTLIVASGKGAYFTDVRGRRYLDGVSSLWVNLHGHRHPVLDRAFKTQLSKIAHSTFLGLSHPSAILLGKELISVAPSNLKRVFYSDNGATAVEVALKMAFQYWIEAAPRGIHRTEFLALKGSYHGDTIGAVSVGSIGAFHSKFKPLLFKSHFAMAPACSGCPYNKKNIHSRFRVGESVRGVPKPGDARAETGCRWECLKDVEGILKKRGKRIAAAIIEPVMQGATGMTVMPPGYVAGFERVCRKYDTLLIADEVATGFGRTGTLFACQQENVRPDLMCLAKALTAGYTPLAATLATQKIFNAFVGAPAQMKTFFHGHSYTGHNLGAAVALANLKLIKSTKLLEKTRQKAHLLRKELYRLTLLPAVKSIRQAGLMAGVEIGPYPSSKRMGARVCRRLLSKGIWLRPLGDTIVVMPPPIISDGDLVRLVRELENAIAIECPAPSFFSSSADRLPRGPASHVSGAQTPPAAAGIAGAAGSPPAGPV